MLIVFPVMGLPKSGGVRVLVELANGLAARGHRVCLLVSRPVMNPGFAVSKDVVIKQANAKGSLIAEFWWLVRNIPRDADAVVANFYVTAYSVAMATLLFGLKGYYLIQDYEPDFFGRDSKRKAATIQRLLATLSYHLPLRQIAISSWLQSIVHNVTGKDILVISDGVDPEVFAPEPASKQERSGVQWIMALGRRDPRKGFAQFLEAMDILSERIPDLHLLVATQDRKLVVDTRFDAEIVHPADDKELAECYRRCNVFAFSSLKEGFGLPPLEAMACGTPVVATECGGVSDFAQNGVNCLLVPAGDPRALADGLYAVLTNNHLAEQLAKAGRETACQFTWDAMIQKVEDAFIMDSC